MSTPEDRVREADHLTALLDAERPRASARQLARAKNLALARARAPKYFPRPKGILMKPRLAITSILTVGLLMSGSGATLAVISDGDSAAISQYPDVPGAAAPEEAAGGVLGEIEEGGVLGEAEEGEAPGAAVRGERLAGPEGAEAPDEVGVAGVTAQAGRQVGAGGGGELPVTGLASIPLIAGGIVLLVVGLALRRAARRPAGA